MIDILLFVATVFIWGTTWIAIAFQVGAAPVIVSVFFRFAMAAILFLLLLAVKGKLHWPARWRFVIVQALCLFCFNFIAFYNAAALMSSGLVSVIFSLASIFNTFNGRLFFGDRISIQTLWASSIGVLGVTLLFWHDLVFGLNGDVLRGVLWAITGTMLFSLGNMASRRNNMDGISPLTANSWGMGIGTLLLLIIILVTQTPITIPVGAVYWAALIYLAAIGSVVGFTTYLLLVARIGSARAGYATVLFPVVALLVSTYVEGYQWRPTAIAGVFMTMLGNVAMFIR